MGKGSGGSRRWKRSYQLVTPSYISYLCIAFLFDILDEILEGVGMATATIVELF